MKNTELEGELDDYCSQWRKINVRECK